MKKYKIHFICRGNIYRSRLAEAYFKSLGDPRFSVTSSGINSFHNPGVEISTYAVHAAEHGGIVPFLSTQKAQTSQAMLDESDIIVFLDTDILKDVTKDLQINTYKSVVWDVADMEERLLLKQAKSNDEETKNKEAVVTFTYLRENVDALVRELTAVNWVDIVSDKNEPLHFRLPLSWANSYGLWRRGSHAIITTPNHSYIIQKRAKNIVFSPSKIDVGVGGSVDAGETPHHAIIREVREELGIEIAEDWMEQIDLFTWDTYHPHYKKYTRIFVYTFHVRLPMDNPAMTPQVSEVASVKLLSRRRLQRLLRIGHVRGIGTLVSGHRYMRQVVDITEARLSGRAE